MLSDRRFWVGVILGVAGVYLWHMYQSKKAAQ